MPNRHLPVRPNLDQLKHQAKDLLRAIHAGDPEAVADLHAFHPEKIDPANVKLADAQLVLARSYESSSWPRLVLACNLIDAIWRDDIEALREIVIRHPQLVHEDARIKNSSWGPPMSYAANLGRDAIVKMLYEFGARDLEHALDRATLQSKIGTARMIHKMMGAPRPVAGCLANPAYTLSASGTALMLELGAQLRDGYGKRIAPVDIVLETDSRKPSAKHKILELYAKYGLELPDTPPMALHRGRIDLLEEHLRRDPNLLTRTFTHQEIFPPECGCHHDEEQATHGTPLGGATLLHMAVDYDEMEIARWLLAKGINADAKAAVDDDGFGGHTALFATVVSQPNFWMNHNSLPQIAPFTELLLQHGANPNARASLRKQLHPGYGEDTMHEFRDVTPLSWGRRFHRKEFVSEPAMKLIAERGGHI
jgi:ankyrin repeat protein